MTYWASLENYGQILQVYALYTYLTKQGHDVFVIKYNGYNDTTLNKSLTSSIWNVCKSPMKLVNYIKTLNKERRILQDIASHDCQFNAFKYNKILWSYQYTSYDELCAKPPLADIYICGSDMIWCEGSKYKPYFLAFGAKQTKRIAYAPSFGCGEISDEYKNAIRPYLECFNFISTREKSGQEICQNMGFSKTQWVPDPTALLSAIDYELIEAKTMVENNYVFLYLMGHDTNIPFEDIYSFAQENQLSVRYRASQGRYDMYAKVYPSIEEWISYMHYANYIITNSFHGCMFAIIFNKKFLFLPLINNASPNNERIYSLLDKCDLKNRIWSGDLAQIYEDINYQEVNKKMDAWVSETKLSLNSHLL